MSEQEVMNEEPIFMEQAEYMEYLKNQVKDTPIENQTPIAQISMYQMNKDLVKGLKKMNNMAINNALEKVAEWFEAHDDLHYVLLNHEKHYYTMFERDFGKQEASTKSFIAEVKDVLTKYYGDNDIRAIDVDTNGAVEIWGMWDGEPSVAYLFPYDEGVVYY